MCLCICFTYLPRLFRNEWSRIMNKKSSMFAAIVLVIIVFTLSEEGLTPRNLSSTKTILTISVSHIDNMNHNIPASNTNGPELSNQNWLLRRNGVSGDLTSLAIVVSDGRYTYRFRLTSQSQDYGCIFIGSVLSIKIVSARGDDVDNILITWKSPVGAGSSVTRLDTSFDIPLY